MIIRNIKKEDIRRCVEIYNYYIINSTATFEEQPLTEAQFAERVKRISADYPYLVAEEDGKVVGYAYLDKYNERSAYRFTADLSIYLDNSCVSHGVGSRLLAEIEKAAFSPSSPRKTPSALHSTASTALSRSASSKRSVSRWISGSTCSFIRKN